MAIPGLDSNGFLPPGVHVCALEEIEESFGRFQATDRRPRLYRLLEDFFKRLRSTGSVVAVIVNGSFPARHSRSRVG